jgi:hypothetical protein
MGTQEVPVDERTRAAAHWAMYGLLAVPTIAILIVGTILKVTGHAEGAGFPGLLGWVVVIGLIQLVIVVVGRTHYLSGVVLSADEGPRPPETDAGIFRHG